MAPVISTTNNDQAQTRRVTSPIDRLTFVVPLLGRSRATVEDASEYSNVECLSDDDTTQSARPGGIKRGIFTSMSALALGTGLSFTGCNFMGMETSANFNTDVSSSALLRGMGLRHSSKTWPEYTREMVDYISSHSYATLAAGPMDASISPILASTFPHFPAEEHGALSSLLPNDVRHWADVHWTIAYSQYMDTYSRQNGQIEDEETLLARFAEYRRNGEKVYHHNVHSIQFSEDPHNVEYLYTLEMNEFADMRPSDLSRYGYIDTNRMNRAKPSPPSDAQHHESLLSGWPSSYELPQNFTWKDEGCVQKVKNQLRCGSCWAFSAVESLESAVCVARKHKKGELSHYRSPGPVSPNQDPDHGAVMDWSVSQDMPNLSEQQLVDCAAKDGNHGCNGGMMEFAFQYAMENTHGGLCEEDSYSYEAVEGVCKETQCSYENDWKVVSWNNVTRFSAKALQQAIMDYGVIAVSVEADSDLFRMYSGGVVHDGKVGNEKEGKQCGTALNHGVAVVGWGDDEHTGEPYWLIKNSWGPKWGENGFIRLARDAGGMFGECGILMDASYPIVKAYAHPSW